MNSPLTQQVSAPAPWIWATPAPVGPNVFCGFRRTFSLERPIDLTLQISADSRYWLYVNGRRIGFGPPRGWPEHWTLDSYTLSPYLRTGRNVLAVLVNHWTEGNFQYRAAPPGLTARLCEGAEVLLQTDSLWLARITKAERSRVPRISVQEPYEEQFHAARDDGWRELDYDDSTWAPAVIVAAPHSQLAKRSIPFLGGEIIPPTRVLASEQVEPCTVAWNLSLKPYFAPNDHSANFCFVRAYLLTWVYTEEAQQVALIRPHHHAAAFWLNGQIMPPLTLSTDLDVAPEYATLKPGWNRLLFPFPGYADALAADLPAGGVHLPVFVLSVRANKSLRWACRREQGGAPWAFLGPFPFTTDQQEKMHGHADWPRVVQAETIHSEATQEVAEAIPAWGAKEWNSQSSANWFREIADEQIAEADVFAEWCGDRPIKSIPLNDATGLLGSEIGTPLTINPTEEPGRAVRLLFDFGQMVVGFHAFTIEAPEGTILDLHNFEFIQPDGRQNLATGMNNTTRYVCRAGLQTFQTLQRRGFRYTWLTIRKPTGPVRLFRFTCHVSTYPQARRGSFQCSDAALNKIWEIGANTLRWCSEDVYTDCPTYEQTHWVGDARNEALVDWVVNGDPRLWFHCLDQVGRGLERLPLVPSQVPSAWDNILPAWSFLWMRSCREYFRWTGDRAGAQQLLPWVRRNIDGIKAHLTAAGLFRIHAWNMFDWAAMDTPNDGVITHQNCLAVGAIGEAADLAELLGKKDEAREWRRLVRKMRFAINRDLWDERAKAYLDCLHTDGRRSKIFSQQTQTAALLSGVAEGNRAKRCRTLVNRSPKTFVKAGSPFFEFFVLELLSAEKNSHRLLDLIRRDWGFMVDQGATTFWELWTLSSGRLTRSHCHGWSSAPTFFLSTTVLGITPHPTLRATIEFSPAPGNLLWFRGCVPTARGLVTVSGMKKNGKWQYRVQLPVGSKLINHARGARVETIFSTSQGMPPASFGLVETIQSGSM